MQQLDITASCDNKTTLTARWRQRALCFSGSVDILNYLTNDNQTHYDWKPFNPNFHLIVPKLNLICRDKAWAVTKKNVLYGCFITPLEMKIRFAWSPVNATFV